MAETTFEWTWSFEFIISPLEDFNALALKNAPNLQNLDSSFVMFDVILEIPLKSIDPKEIVELSNTQSNPPLNKQKPNVDGVGKKKKKSYNNINKFQV